MDGVVLNYQFLIQVLSREKKVIFFAPGFKKKVVLKEILFQDNFAQAFFFLFMSIPLLLYVLLAWHFRHLHPKLLQQPFPIQYLHGRNDIIDG